MGRELVKHLSCNGTKWYRGEFYDTDASESEKCGYYVYRHFCKCSGKSYIGFSSSPNVRWSAHVSEARCSRSATYKTKFKKAIRKYGPEAFEHEILSGFISKEDASTQERNFIEKYDTYKNGYNSTIGGEGQSSEFLLTNEFIIERAKEFFESNGRPPKVRSGPVINGHEGDTWAGYDICLRDGLRGLPGGTSLAKLLTQQCGFVYRLNRPILTEDYILEMAELHKSRTGKWPTQRSGSVFGGHSGDNWALYETLLRKGGRGLPGGNSLARLISSKHPHVHSKNKRPLTESFIVERAIEFKEMNGSYPIVKSGPVHGWNLGDTWDGYDKSLSQGTRGLPGGSSLKKLLSRELGAINHMDRPLLTVEFILSRAKEFISSSGGLPRYVSGEVAGGHPGDTWKAYDEALKHGCRGLPGGSTLSKLLKAHLTERTDILP